MTFGLPGTNPARSLGSGDIPAIPQGPTGLGTSAARVRGSNRVDVPDRHSAAHDQSEDFDLSKELHSGVAATTLTCATPPPGFPPSIPLRRQAYRNWAGTVGADDVWTCAPRTAADVVTLTNWAWGHEYRLRAIGRKHNFSPLTVAGHGCDEARVVLVDTTQYLTGMRLVTAPSAAVAVEPGASLRSLLTYLESHGYGLTAVPACGELTVGGVLAIGGHGTGVPAVGEHQQTGHMYGSLSDLVVSITAVVWDQVAGQYVLRTFHRSHPSCAAFLTHLGRAFITEVTLRIGAVQALRCVSDVTATANELFAAPAAASDRSFSALVACSGRVETFWFPFTNHTWTKVWSLRPQCPSRSRPVVTPYNYPFSDNIPECVAEMVFRLVTGSPELAPELSKLQYTTAVLGLTSTASTDLWGLSKNLLLYAKPTGLRYSTNGYAILTRHADIQRVIHEFSTFFQDRILAYQKQGRYPVNGPLEIRVTGLDHAGDIDVPSAQPPALSAVRPDRDNPHWDVAVWLDVLSFPDTPDSGDFYREIEEFILTHYRAPYALPRMEWSKGWAYTAEGPWRNPTVLTRTIPSTFGATWQWAINHLNTYDPHRIFSNAFLDRLL
jgi:FAD/FMN-containing dehydrogenase